MKVRTEARREAIINEATDLFCELGFERTSMRTLYGYFASKEVLFEAVIQQIGDSHLDSALKDLLDSEQFQIEDALFRFGMAMTILINDPKALAVYRMVIAESGRSEIGKKFYKIGPQRVIDALNEFITHALEKGILRGCEPSVAARHFLFLIKSESEHHLFECDPPDLKEEEIRDMVIRATDVFMAAYMSSSYTPIFK